MSKRTLVSRINHRLSTPCLPRRPHQSFQDLTFGLAVHVNIKSAVSYRSTPAGLSGDKHKQIKAKFSQTDSLGEVIILPVLVVHH